MHRAVLAALVCTVAGSCHPYRQIDLVSIHSLLSDPDPYVGREIAVTIEAGRYTAHEDRIEVRTGLPGAAPVLVFRGASLSAATGAIIIRGVVQAPVRDGVDRGMGYTFAVELVECRLMTRLR